MGIHIQYSNLDSIHLITNLCRKKGGIKVTLPRIQCPPLPFLPPQKRKESQEVSAEDFDEALKVHEIWEEVWSDGTPGTEGGIK